MKKGTIILLSIVVLLLMIGGYIWSTYNSLITMNESVDNQWAQVESQYQRRFDLIPNLVASVQGMMQQEQKIFGDLAEARTKYGNAKTINEKATAATEVEGSLSRLLVVMENYPQLKSSENVTTLMTQLEGTENRISTERKRYNDEVKSFNVMIKRIPAKFIANSLGFTDKEYFQAEAGSEKAPKVDLQTK